jgi:hypothetical protein
VIGADLAARFGIDCYICSAEPLSRLEFREPESWLRCAAGADRCAVATRIFKHPGVTVHMVYAIDDIDTSVQAQADRISKGQNKWPAYVKPTTSLVARDLSSWTSNNK